MHFGNTFGLGERLGSSAVIIGYACTGFIVMVVFIKISFPVHFCRHFSLDAAGWNGLGLFSSGELWPVLNMWTYKKSEKLVVKTFVEPKQAIISFPLYTLKSDLWEMHTFMIVTIIIQIIHLLNLTINQVSNIVIR